MAGAREALESQRRLEQEFVAEALKSETAPKGWPAALIMFHVAMWRERLRDALRDFSEGREVTPAPSNIDELNDAELATGIGTPLADAAARSHMLFGELIDVYEHVGEKPFAWGAARTTTEAVLRNSYTHPRVHIYGYLNENGDPEKAHALSEESLSEMRKISAPPLILGTVLYNAATVRIDKDEQDQAVELLAECFTLRPDLRVQAARDADLSPLHGHPRFQELLKP